MKKSPLYTATGDSGTTSLIGGTRASKASPQIDAYGTIDELNSHIGIVRAAMNPDSQTDSALNTIQCRLFDIGTALATPANTTSTPPRAISQDDIAALEREIDRIDSLLPRLHSFVLPGGTLPAAQAHVARTVCRRAERTIVALTDTVPVHPSTLTYLNRLSDYLFAIARFNNIKENHTEIFWSKDC
jgi:cob(I)alamin adenosyltransferase